MGAAWHSRLPYRVKRMMFIAFIVNTMFSGMTAFALSDRHYRSMDKVLVSLLRSLMMGRAAWLTEAGCRTLTNEQVFKHWRIAPSKVELAVRRLKMLVRWTARPERHCQGVMAVFGNTRLDEKCKRR
eukprot:4882061-Lingulodinium_polyedra.AAC.1